MVRKGQVQRGRKALHVARQAVLPRRALAARFWAGFRFVTLQTLSGIKGIVHAPRILMRVMASHTGKILATQKTSAHQEPHRLKPDRDGIIHLGNR